MPDLVNSERTEKVVKSMTEFDQYLMVEPRVAQGLREAQLVFTMQSEGKTVYPMFEGVTFADVKNFIKEFKQSITPKKTKRSAPISIEGEAPDAPENHPEICKGQLKTVRKEIYMRVVTECPTHGVKAHVIKMPDDLATVALVAMADASHHAKHGVSVIKPPKNPSLN